MKQYKFLLPAIFYLLIVSCSSQKKSEISTYKFKKDATKIYFNILQLNDVYEIAPIQGGKFGGMARVETVRQNLLKEDKNTMAVLAGDFLNPSLIGTMKVNGERVRGKQMIEVMNAMNFDVVAFGNHEFDLSYTHLQQRLNESNFEWISSNVRHKVKDSSELFYKEHNQQKIPLQESFIKEIKGENGDTLKIGFISVCIPSNPKSYVVYSDIYTEIKRAYNQIKNKVDLVIGLTHLSLAQDKKVAELLPNLPLIMGGHEHTNSYDKVGDVIIAKADANAKTAYIHRFEYDPTTKKVQFKSELKEINNQISADEKVGKVVAKWQSILTKKVKEIIPNPNQTVYTTSTPLDATETSIRSKQTNMGEIITKAMSFAYKNKVDCALVNGGSVRIDDMLKGAINTVDIFRVLPYGGAVLKVDIKGDLLRDVLEFGLKAKGTGAYLQRYNAGKINGVWTVNGVKIKNDKTYTVAFSDYLLKGLDIPILSDKNPKILKVYKPINTSELSFDIRNAVVKYLKNN